ncbi:hypothetical protein Pcinc_029916 [Petrolisthes cinctipes]|uniref:DUF4789 domain-containing protein n=1 Tax=Petrolisthes cinctipes TaxID=88211 RepID=A0AAE1K3B8_PETCI|nr:hypothetical protein Pcinc_029916 [Petrolisthes cinctipes]
MKAHLLLNHNNIVIIGLFTLLLCWETGRSDAFPTGPENNPPSPPSSDINFTDNDSILPPSAPPSVEKPAPPPAVEASRTSPSAFPTGHENNPPSPPSSDIHFTDNDSILPPLPPPPSVEEPAAEASRTSPTTTTTFTRIIKPRAASEPFVLGSHTEEKKEMTERPNIVFQQPQSQPQHPPQPSSSTLAPPDSSRLFIPELPGVGVVASSNPISNKCQLKSNQSQPQNTGTTANTGISSSGTSFSSCLLSSGNVLHEGLCKRLLAQETCAEKEWLVLIDNSNDNTRPIAECKPRPCPFGKLEYKGQCVNPSDGNICAYGQMLYVEMTGETYCDCEYGFTYDLISGNCYARQEQGQCSFGHYLDLTEDCTVACVPNKCLVDGFVGGKNEDHTAVNSRTNGDHTAANSGTNEDHTAVNSRTNGDHTAANSRTNEDHTAAANSKTCYRKMYYGFCDDAYKIYHQVNGTVECDVIFVRPIIDVVTLRNCPIGSRMYFQDRCRQPYRFPSTSTYKSLYGECGIGFKKDPRGACRKIHSIFG